MSRRPGIYPGRLRLSKNYKQILRDRVAGEREGARPASRYNNLPSKGLIYQDF